jgi:hypothetical protein
MADLVSRGRARARDFAEAEGMAARYLQVFREVVQARDRVASDLQGIFADGWSQSRVVVHLPSSRHLRLFEIRLRGESWWPSDHISVTVTGGLRSRKYLVRRGRTITIRKLVPMSGALIEINCDRVFQPQQCGVNNDTRDLGPLCVGCRVLSTSGSEHLFSATPPSNPEP